MAEHAQVADRIQIGNASNRSGRLENCICRSRQWSRGDLQRAKIDVTPAAADFKSQRSTFNIGPRLSSQPFIRNTDFK